jgi:hypothetical protein
VVSQQLPLNIDRQGFDAAVVADEARTDAGCVELRIDACLAPEFLTPEFSSWLAGVTHESPRSVKTAQTTQVPGLRMCV